MRVYAMKTNHVENPLGFELSPVTFSWKVGGTQSAAATSSRVEIAKDEAFSEVLYDSGHDGGISNLAFTPADYTPAPRTRYYWRVTVTGSDGDRAVSQPSWFETGKMDEPWDATWIVPPFDKAVHPCFARRVNIEKEVASARIYSCGLGVYELFIDGAKVGDEFLAPGFHSYDNWLQVQTYDVTKLLSQGENDLYALLGNGWAKGRFGPGEMEELFCGEFAFIAEIHVTYVSGESLVIKTDGEWSCAPSPVMESSIYDGEISADLAGVKLDGSVWEKAVVSEDYQAGWGLGPLCDRLSLPVKSMAEIKPVSLIRTPAGEDVLDMGQNMVGRLRFKCDAAKGSKLSLYFGEILQDGNFYRDNLRSAKAEYHYISGGCPSVVTELFTFYGFRYVKLEGFENINIDDFTGVVLYSDMAQTGMIETSDERVNRLFQNVLWGQRGNFLDVPTDCPQRDERFGWTGDAQIFCETAAWNMDVYAFFRKYLCDMAYDQTASGGAIPHAVPDVYPRKTGRSLGGAACGWADAATVIPWTIYQMYGDIGVLRSAFPVMSAWVDWIRAEDDRSGGRRLWTTGFHFGDWLAMDAPVPGGVFGATDVGYIASAYYYYSASLTAKAAEALGDIDNAAVYSELSAEIRTAIINEFFTPNGRIAVKTQTAMALALQFGLYPEGSRERLLEDLKTQLVSDGMQLKTGFLGTPAICPVLSENGAHMYALGLFFRDEMPGWLYPVAMGATTIWERWDSVLPDGRISDTGMNSLNHYSFGCIAGWMYRYVCGIIPLKPGFTTVRLEPRPCRQLEFARATFDSPCGDIVCGWKKLPDGRVEAECRIPFGVAGEFLLPGEAFEEVTKLFPDARLIDGKTVAELKTGRYNVVYTPAPRSRYDLDTPVYELLADGRTAEVFASIPAFKILPENILAYSFGELLDFIGKQFPHLWDGVGALSAVVMGIERE